MDLCQQSYVSLQLIGKQWPVKWPITSHNFSTLFVLGAFSLWSHCPWFSEPLSSSFLLNFLPMCAQSIWLFKLFPLGMLNNSTFCLKFYVCMSEWVKSLSHVQLFVTPLTVAYRAPPSMGFSRQEYWSGLPFPSPGDLPNPGIKPWSPALQADALLSEPSERSWCMHT